MQELYLSKKQLPFVIVIDKMETKPKKGKKYVFKTFVNKCHENWKKSKNYLLIVLSPAKQKIKSQDLFKKHQNWSKTDQNWSETWSKLIRNLCHLKVFFVFSLPSEK